MKRVLIALLILAAVAGLCIADLCLSRNTLERLTTQMDELERLSYTTETVVYAEKVQLWEQEVRCSTRWMPLFFHHNQVDELWESSLLASSYAREGEAEELRAQMRRCRFLLEEICEQELPYPVNIF